MATLTIPRYKVFGGKRYQLAKAFLGEGEAKSYANKIRKAGYKARIWQKSGELHLIKRYHVYWRD